ncbi:MAG: glutamate--tRNA ligase, partial [bacterium]
VRLKDLGNIKIISQDQAEYIGDDLSILKEGAKIIHWLGYDTIPTKLYMPDGSEKEGICERILEKDIGRVVQFERLGFARIEEKEGVYEAYFAHR